MKAIILAGGSGTRLHPITRAVNKHLLPLYNKPMIYYPLSVMMMAGAKDVLLIVNPHDLEDYRRLLGDGREWGVNIEYAVQEKPAGIAQAFTIGRSFVGSSRVGLILGDNVFYGDALPALARKGANARGEAVVYAYPVSDPERYGVVEFDANDRVISLEEKPKQPRSTWAVTGLYFYDADVCDAAAALKPSARGELEITDLNRVYLQQDRLRVVKFGRGYAWLDTGTPQSMLRAAEFIEVIEERQGLLIGSPEEVAWRTGRIDDEQLAKLVQPIRNSDYGRYLKRLLDEGRR